MAYVAEVFLNLKHSNPLYIYKDLTLVDEKDEIYHVIILILQYTYFRPFPNKYVELSDNIIVGDLDGIERLIT